MMPLYYFVMNIMNFSSFNIKYMCYVLSFIRIIGRYALRVLIDRKQFALSSVVFLQVRSFSRSSINATSFIQSNSSTQVQMKEKEHL